MAVLWRLGGLALAAGALWVAWGGQRILTAGPARLSGLPWLFAGCAALAAILWWAERGQRSAGPTSAHGRTGALVHGTAVIAVLLLGVWVRVVDFATVPGGMNHDAAWNGMYATYIRSGAEFTPYTSAAWGRETLFMYVVAPFQSYYGNSMEAVQAASTLVGVLALLPMYLFVRALFGPVAGLAGMAFFALSGWHWVFSRVGWRCVTVPPFELLAVFGLWRALRTDARWAWWLAGAATAGSIYTYNAARGVPLIIGGLVFLHLVTERQQWRKILAGCVHAGFAFLAVGGPMLWYAANNWIKFQGRAEHLLSQRPEKYPILANVADALGMFNYQGNGNDFFTANPLLQPQAAVWLVVGALLIVLKLREPAARFTLAGFLLSLLPGVVSFPNGNRCITAMPFVFAAIGWAVATAHRALAGAVGGRAGSTIAGAALTASLALAAIELHGEFLADGRTELRGVSVSATAAGEFLGEFGEDYQAYAVSSEWPRYTLMYLGYTHGSPLEPPLAPARSFAEIEGQISRYGRRGLVLVTDLSRVGKEARSGIKRIFAEAEERTIPARRTGQHSVARAVVVAPQSASKTAAWSNVSRVVSVAADADAVARATFCPEAVATAAGLAMRLRLMVPVTPTASATVGLTGDCSDGAQATAGWQLSVSPQGIVLDAPVRHELVAGERIEPGRWYDVGLVSDSRGNVRVLFNGASVAQGRWSGRPASVGGLRLSATGRGADQPVLMLDDVGITPHAVSDGSPWWRGSEIAHGEQGLFADFEGVPLGKLAGRPGWSIEGGDWRTQAGPGSATGGAAVPAQNAFDGGKGKSPGRFDEPMGVGVDASGNVYVTERLNHRVQKFAADGTYLGEWGRHGGKPGEFREPLDLDVEGDQVYVMDTWNTRIQIFDLDGNYLRQIGPDPLLGKPRGIDVRDGKVYVANSGRGNIVVFDQDGKLSKIFPGEGEPPLQQVVDVAVDSQGNVYAHNSKLGQIDVFDASGERIRQIAVAEWSAPYLKEFYLTIDDRDVLYAGDWDLRGVRRFASDGAQLEPVGPRMEQPSGMAFRDGRLYVAARADSVIKVVELPR